MTTKEQELEVVRKFIDEYNCETIINDYEPYTLYKESDIAIIAGIIDIDSVIWRYNSTEKLEYVGSDGCATFLTYKGLCRLASSTIIEDKNNYKLEIENIKAQLQPDNNNNNIISSNSSLLIKNELLEERNKFLEKMVNEMLEIFNSMQSAIQIEIESKNQWRKLLDYTR